MTDAFDITLPDSAPADTPVSVRRVHEHCIRSAIREEVPGKSTQHKNIFLKYLYKNTFFICCSIETCGCSLQHLKGSKCLCSRIEIRLHITSITYCLCHRRCARKENYPYKLAFLLWNYHPTTTLDLENTQTEQLAHFRLFFLQPNTLPTEGLHVYIYTYLQLLYSTQASNRTIKHRVFLSHLNSLSMRIKWVISQLHSLYKQKLPISLYSSDHNLILSLSCIFGTGRSDILFIRQNSESHHFNTKDNKFLLLTKH